MKWYTHINRGTIDSNRKSGSDVPPITVKHGKHGKPMHASEVEFPAGARLIYSAADPILPCGARAVIVSDTAPTIIR